MIHLQVRGDVRRAMHRTKLEMGMKAEVENTEAEADIS